tara:strand:+ start:5763 stop:6500 length:738 start_codon:yes stop_codon:yes gene_type:complete
VNEILSNLVAEQQLLDQYLQSIPVRNWNTKTSFKNWNITAHVSYLSALEDLGYNALKKKGSDFNKYKGPKGLEKFEKEAIAKGKDMRPQDVIEWWRMSRASVIESLAKCTPGKKITWWKNEIDCRTFAVTKLAETWAHSLDVYESMNKDYEDTVRVEHVALYGWLNAENATKLNKSKFEDLRIELIGPEYKAWQFGNENSKNTIKGSAGDWCRVVTGRTAKNFKPTLTTEGDFASKFLKFNHVKI